MVGAVKKPIFALAVLLFAARPVLQAADPSPSPLAEQDPAGIVRAYMEAFNQHNVPALAERVSPDFVWFNVNSDRATVEVKGRDSLRKNLASYFEKTSSVRSEIEDLVIAGDYVSFRERAVWNTLFGERSQSSLAVYEVKNGLITRAWYFPAAK